MSEAGFGAGFVFAGVLAEVILEGDLDFVDDEDGSETDFLIKTTWLPSFCLCSMTF